MIIRKLVGKQRASYSLAADGEGNLWEGAVRSSKTISSILRWIKYLRTAPDGDLLMIGKTERTLKRNVLDPMVDILGKSRCRVTWGAGEARILGRRVYLTGANDERAAEKIRGMTLVGWYGDELTTWPKEVFDIARTRLSLEGATWFGTTNPAAPNHWLKADFIDRAKLHLTRDGRLLRTQSDDALALNVFSFVIADNPTLPASFVAQLLTEYTGVFRRRFILGEWVMAEGSIYEMFDDKVHVVPANKVPRIVRWPAAGIDYGTTNPFHAGLLGVGADKRLYLVHEWRYDSRATLRQLSAAQYSTALRTWLATRYTPGGEPTPGIDPEYVAVDPSEPGFRVQLWQDGLRSMGADNSVIDGIRVVGSLFAADKLRISDACPHLIREIPGYAWDDRAAKLGEDKPIKVDDHGCDMLRYAAKTTEHVWRRDVWGEAA